MDSIIKISDLSDVKPFKTAWSVQVKVLHTWISYSQQFGASLQMVLTDEKGVKIQASCNQSLLQRLERQFVVGEWKVVTNFKLSPTCGFFRHTNHVYKIVFVEQTVITDSKLACHNMFLELHSFSQITNGSRDPCYLIDVIGEVVDIGDLDIMQDARIELPKLELTLRDIEDQTLQCCFTGKLAWLLTQEKKQPRIGDICLIRFARIVNYKGELHLSNAFDTSSVFINPDIKEAEELKRKFQSGDNSPYMYHHSLDMYQRTSNKNLMQEKRLKWSQYPFRTIQEMKRCAKVENCRVICTVYAIDTLSGWYYLACVLCQNKVFKKTIPNDKIEDQGWWCEFCHNSVTNVSARYKLDLLVQDLTGESKFTLQDPAATDIVTTPAAKVVNLLLDEAELTDVLPPQIVEIVGKTYGFGISFDENYTSLTNDLFNAIKVWSLKEVIWKRTKTLHQNSIYSKIK